MDQDPFIHNRRVGPVRIIITSSCFLSLFKVPSATQCSFFHYARFDWSCGKTTWSVKTFLLFSVKMFSDKWRDIQNFGIQFHQFRTGRNFFSLAAKIGQKSKKNNCYRINFLILFWNGWFGFQKLFFGGLGIFIFATGSWWRWPEEDLWKLLNVELERGWAWAWRPEP